MEQIKPGQVVYLRRGNRIVLLLVNHVRGDELVDGIVFDDKRSGIIAHLTNIKRGINDGQWLSSYDESIAAAAIDRITPAAS